MPRRAPPPARCDLGGRRSRIPQLCGSCRSCAAACSPRRRLLRPPCPAAPPPPPEFPPGTALPPIAAKTPRPTTPAATPYDDSHAMADARPRPTASRCGHTTAQTACPRPTTPPPCSPTGTSARPPHWPASIAVAAAPPPLPL